MHATTLLLLILTFDVQTDASLTRWGIMDIIHPFRGLWYKSEIDHINAVELETIENGV